MKTETREVKQLVEVYISDDGIEFDNEEECRGYEMECLEKTLSFYDQEFDPCGLDACVYAVLKTQEDVDALIRLCAYEGIHVPGLRRDKPGIYMYTYRFGKDEWVNISEIVDRLRGERVPSDECGIKHCPFDEERGW